MRHRLYTLLKSQKSNCFPVLCVAPEKIKVALRDADLLKQSIRLHIKQEYRIIQMNNAIVSTAQKLIEDYPVRAYDAVQLASAIEINKRLLAINVAPSTFVSADQRLLIAASAEGVTTENPNLHP